MKKLEKKLVIDNGYWKVFQTFFEKNGKIGNIITMGKSQNLDAILIIPITKDKEIIYIKEFRFGPGEMQIAFPTGGVDLNEKTEESVERELLEETGYKAEKVIPLGGYYNHNNYIEGKIYIFLGINCEEIGEQKLENLEEIEVHKTSIENFEKMIKNNEIHCPWSEIAFRRTKKITNNFENLGR